MSSCDCGCGTNLEDAKHIACHLCNKLFNLSCVNLTQTDAKTIKNKRGILWACLSCCQVGSVLSEIQKALNQLKNDMENIKSNLLPSTPNQICPGDEQFELLINELEERQNRKRNIMVFNLKECQSNVTNTERNLNDQTSVTEILNEVFPSASNEISKVIRIGKYEDGKNRPVKLCFNNDNIVRSTLKHASKLKYSSHYKHISLSYDRTPAQLKYYNTLKDQLIKEQANSTDQLKIKFIRGVPKIVTVERNPSQSLNQ